MSCTLTSNDFSSKLSEPSIAVQFTVVSPILKVLPDDGMHCGTMLPPTSSVAETSKLTIAPGGPVAQLSLGHWV